MTIKQNRQECLFYQSHEKNYPIRLLRLVAIIKPFYQGERSDAKSFFGLLQEAHGFPVMGLKIFGKLGREAMGQWWAISGVGIGGRR
jgi:hypothetical protein